ncbi:hypothetical protein B0T17DRAFT_592447 [Bombardia bombarda]|uniref:Cyclin-D1-binding protein 1-like N-terminal domain-containing protein n=1 Tax=Bombardia bombarda TaxID=252184 RepID=A0AA39WHY4_9PEZI|nr:hypothetical protein B0T17DRAFT_592447 [Bombardia bombarda]
MPPFKEELETLASVVSSTIALITQLETVVASVVSQKHPEPDNSSASDSNDIAPSPAPIEALSLAHDSATLIKAHATKISLFIINEPFSPNAIVKVLRDLCAGAIPGLASAVQLCTAARYTQTIRRDLAWQSGRVLKELRELVARVPADGRILSDAKKNAAAGAKGGKGSIAATGVLWAACDDVVAFATRGFAGNLVQKVEQFRDTLKDVMEELKEWGEETRDDDEDEDEDDEDDDEDDDDGVDGITKNLESTHVSDTQAMLDDLMNSQQYIPSDDPDRIRERLESCLKRLRLTALLYQATIKRRLKPLPKLPPTAGSPIPARLDEILPLLKNLPERFGSLAMAFYELEPSEIDRLMDQCFFEAFAVSELLVKPWDGPKDEFTDWALRFQVEIKKG